MTATDRKQATGGPNRRHLSAAISVQIVGWGQDSTSGTQGSPLRSTCLLGDLKSEREPGLWSPGVRASQMLKAETSGKGFGLGKQQKGGRLVARAESGEVVGRTDCRSLA